MSAQSETHFTLEREIERTKTEKSGEKLETRKEGKGEGEGDEQPLETLQDRETTHALVDQWGVRNLYRSAVSFLAGCAGLYAALST